MRNQRPDLILLGIIVLVLLLTAGLVWGFINWVIPTGGNDVFAPIWEASRNVLRGGDNPYTAQAVARASILLGDSAYDPYFVYPYYSIAIFAPFALISSYTMARAAWMTFLVACLVGTIFATLAITRWQPKPLAWLVFVIFSLGSLPAVRAIYLGNPAVLVTLLIAIGILLVVKEQYGVAGVFFGFTILKPQMVFLLIPFVFLWAVSHRRMQMVWSLLITIVLVVGVSLVVHPLWWAENYLLLLTFYTDRFPLSPLDFIGWWLSGSGPRVMMAVAIVLGLWMLLEWWRALGKDSRWFMWTAAFTLVITNLIGLPTSISNHVALLIPFTLGFSLWAQRWPRAGTRLSMVVMVVIAAAGWGLYLLGHGLDLAAAPGAVNYFYAPLVALILLYWVRFWALHTIQLKATRLEALRKL